MRRIALFGVLIALPLLRPARPGRLAGLGETDHHSPGQHRAGTPTRSSAYVTSFEFTGEDAEVARVVPPRRADRREARRRLDPATTRAEVRPPLAETFAGDQCEAPLDQAEVLPRRRSTRSTSPSSRRWRRGRQVGARPRLLLTPDAPKVLDFYSKRSPVFMAA